MHSNGCPCEGGESAPPFNYYCESGYSGTVTPPSVLYTSDPLWDGAGCESEGSCCSTAPWFTVDLVNPILLMTLRCAFVLTVLRLNVLNTGICMTFVGLLLAAFVAVIVLVILTLALNLTVAVGTLNGILFFASIVSTSTNAYFSLT